MHFYDTSNKEVKISKKCTKYWWLVLIYYSWIMTSRLLWKYQPQSNSFIWNNVIHSPLVYFRAFPVNFVTCSTRLLWGNLLVDIFSSALLSSFVFLCAVQRVAQLRHSDRHCRVGVFTKSCLYQRTIHNPLSNRSDPLINKSRVR